MDRPHRVIRFQLSNLTDAPCTVSLEPLGDQADLPKGEVFTVEVSGPGDGPLEISYAPNGVIIGEWNGAKTRLLNRQGERVQTH